MAKFAAARSAAVKMTAVKFAAAKMAAARMAAARMAAVRMAAVRMAAAKGARGAGALLLLAATLASADAGKLGFLDPPGLFQPSAFSQIALVDGGKLVLISGQTARNAAAEIVGTGNLERQTAQVFENLKIALNAVGADFEDVAKLTTYVVNLKPDDRLVIADAIKAHFPAGRRPAHTLVGISALALPELLIEIEAVAVVSD